MVIAATAKAILEKAFKCTGKAPTVVSDVIARKISEQKQSMKNIFYRVDINHFRRFESAICAKHRRKQT
ncbi:hypothetical protein [uncultured Nisaea sp.]|jgi:hypothetical protein|uniref:hypothetical protein n=1 Tax=uncultured Nisaea sp. TaxID=538215 RepID=UPI0030EEA1A6|tara:strand:- start:1360 stop:1566 length:207 start_codon:yes stop_codon:yes gene_type:complete